MAGTSGAPRLADGRREGGPAWPESGVGRAAVIVGVVALLSWFVLPGLAESVGDSIPNYDNIVMPAIAMTLMVAAALLSAYAYWVQKERATTLVITLVLSIVIAVFVVLLAIGNGFGAAEVAP